ncbi:MAG: hypothetical protein JNM31_05975 [Flavobacteriales bacterium]|nr:hypothetical protein [Flavobacteriales bacterium]
MRGLLIHIALLSSAPVVQAQEVRAQLDTAIIRLGERAHLIMDVSNTGDAIPTVTWPVVGDTLRAQVEVVERHGPDTITRDGRAMLRMTYGLTSFEAGFWALSPLPLVVDGRSMETEAMVLEVRTVEADPGNSLRPPKPVIGPRMPAWLLWVEEHALHLSAGALLLVALLFLLLRKRKPASAMPPPLDGPAPGLHERTLAALASVRERQLWQQGMVKQHHAETTDILRAFIEERYRVPALERTTDELLRQLRLSSMPADHRERLRNMLQLADMVKFAKWMPGALENEEVLNGAIQFVKDTPEPTPATDAH